MPRRNPLAAARYADALYQVVDSKDKALEELRAFAAALESSKELEVFFISPIVPLSEQKATLEGLKEKFAQTYRFLIALAEAKRFDIFSQIVGAFERLQQQETGELSVEVKSAHPLSPKLLDEIKALLSEKWQRKLMVKTSVDAALLGGFIATAPGKVFDASAASQLDALEHQMLAG